MEEEVDLNEGHNAREDTSMFSTPDESTGALAALVNNDIGGTRRSTRIETHQKVIQIYSHIICRICLSLNLLTRREIFKSGHYY